MSELDEVKKVLFSQQYVDEINKILGVEAELYLQIAYNYLESNPKIIVSNSRDSIYSAIKDGAKSGLFLDGKEGYLRPSKGTVKFTAEYQGLLKLMRKSGELDSINFGIAYQEDVFEYYVDESGPHLKHTIDFKKKDRGARFAVYCIAIVKNSKTPYIEIMTEEEVMNCKKAGSAGDNSPWNGKFDGEMWKKSVANRISKRLPKSSDYMKVLPPVEIEEEEKTEGTEPANKKEPSALKQALKEISKEPVATKTASEPVVTKPAEEPKIEKEIGKVSAIKSIKSGEVTVFGVTINGKIFSTTDSNLADSLGKESDYEVYYNVVENQKSKKKSFWITEIKKIEIPI